MQVLSPVTAAGPLPILTGFPVRPRRAPQHNRMIAQYDAPVKRTFGKGTATGWAYLLFRWRQSGNLPRCVPVEKAFNFCNKHFNCPPYFRQQPHNQANKANQKNQK